MSRAPLWMAIAAIALAGGCTEATSIRTYPPGAQVTIDEKPIGVSPTVFRVPSHDVAGTYKYRIDHDGYLPAEGELRTRVSTGRIVGAVFTTCITCIFRGFRTLPDNLEVELKPLNSGLTAPGGNAGSTADRLRRIQDLYDQGLMTEQEYKRYRSQLLHEAAGLPEPERP